MALVNLPTATLTYVMLDEAGNKGRAKFNVPYATLVAVAMTGADLFTTALGGVTDCAILGYSLSYSKWNDDMPNPAPKSRIWHKGAFHFSTAVGKKVKYEIPGVKPGIVKSTGQIDEDLAGVRLFTTALLAVDSMFCDSNGVDLKHTLEAYERGRTTTRDQLPSQRSPDVGIVPELDEL